MSALLVVFAIWLLWNLLVLLITTPEWFPPLVAMVLGVIGQLLLEPSRWYLGIGLAGAAGFLVLAGDLVLVITDAIRGRILMGAERRR
jgi:hypothetical protein